MEELTGGQTTTAETLAGEPSRPEVEAALKVIKTRLRGHGGDVSVGDISGGVVNIEFQGACRGCPAQGFTYVAVVEPALAEVPGVKGVTSSRSHLAPAVIERIRRMSRRIPATTAGPGAK